jgi:hypothetical protein
MCLFVGGRTSNEILRFRSRQGGIAKWHLNGQQGVSGTSLGCGRR